MSTPTWADLRALALPEQRRSWARAARCDGDAGGKQTYVDREAATRAIRAARRFDVRLRSYRCSGCGRWHLTSSRP